MRVLEILIACLVLVGPLVAFVISDKAERRKSRFVFPLYCALLAIAVGVHLVVEGAHWQMGPVYLAALLMAFAIWLRGRTRLWGIIGMVAAVLGTALGCGLSYVLPVIALPAPTGTYAIGTHIVSMVDASRKEDADPASGHAREVVVQIWYPALPSRMPRAPYRRRSETSLASSYQSVSWTHARYDAPIAEIPGGFPVVIYNPGWNGRRTQNSILTEELASHGYVVVAIDHPYNSGPAALADGRVIRPIPSPELFDSTSTAASIYAIINKEVAKETDDAMFVLSQIERMNDDPASIFHAHLELTRIGALGYSLGGAVAAEMAHRSAKIRAVLVLDTPLYGEAAKSGVEQPLMLLSEEQTHPSADQRARMSPGERRDMEMDEQDYAHQLPLMRKQGDYQISLPGTLHTSFQDGILTSPLQRFSGAGTIPPRRLIPILRAYTVAFFDQSLRGIASPLLSARTSPFPEASVQFSSPPR